MCKTFCDKTMALVLLCIVFFHIILWACSIFFGDRASKDTINIVIKKEDTRSDEKIRLLKDILTTLQDINGQEVEVEINANTN